MRLVVMGEEALVAVEGEERWLVYFELWVMRGERETYI